MHTEPFGPPAAVLRSTCPKVKFRGQDLYRSEPQGYRWATTLPEGRKPVPEQQRCRRARCHGRFGDLAGPDRPDAFPHRLGARIFALLALYLVVWSVAILVQRLTIQPGTVFGPANAIEGVAAFMLPVTTLHIALVLTVEGRRSPMQQAVLAAAYAVSIAMAIGAVLFPTRSCGYRHLTSSCRESRAKSSAGGESGSASPSSPPRSIGSSSPWRARAGTSARRRQLLAALATVVVGAIGGILRFLPATADEMPWLGVSFVTVGVVLAAYAVFTQGVFLSPQIAGRAFRYSVAIGLAVTLYVSVVVVVERFAQRLVGVDEPIVRPSPSSRRLPSSTRSRRGCAPVSRAARQRTRLAIACVVRSGWT